MIKKDDFFIEDNKISCIPDECYAPMKMYVQFLDAFARSTYKSIYVIDYYKKNFLYVSDNPLFLCGMNAEEVREMGYEFFIKHVPENDLPLILEINRSCFSFIKEIPAENRLEYSLSYDLQINQPNGKKLLINHKMTPLQLSDDGKIWLTLCTASLSAHSNFGNIEVKRVGFSTRWRYSLAAHSWTEYMGINLTTQEKEVLYLSAQGCTMSNISKQMCKSLDTIKGYKRCIFSKLGAASTTEAINMAINEKMI